MSTTNPDALLELAAFANLRIKVEGTWDGDRIVVASMAAADAGTASSVR